MLLLDQAQPLVLDKEVTRQLLWIGQPRLPWLLLLVDLSLQKVDQIGVADFVFHEIFGYKCHEKLNKELIKRRQKLVITRDNS